MDSCVATQMGFPLPLYLFLLVQCTVGHTHCRNRKTSPIDICPAPTSHPHPKPPLSTSYGTSPANRTEPPPPPMNALVALSSPTRPWTTDLTSLPEKKPNFSKIQIGDHPRIASFNKKRLVDMSWLFLLAPFLQLLQYLLSFAPATSNSQNQSKASRSNKRYSYLSLAPFSRQKKQIKNAEKKQTSPCTSAFLLSLLLSHQLQMVVGHFSTMCAGTRTPSTAASNLCSDEDIYIFMSESHGQMTGYCYNDANQGRVDVLDGSLTTLYAQRPTVGNVLTSASMQYVPACGAAITGPTNTMGICKASSPPTHCGNRYSWHRYGPIPVPTDVGGTYTVKYYGGGCTSQSNPGVRSTMTFQTKLCTCTTPGEGLTVGVANTCDTCPQGQASANNKSPCQACTAGKYQDQNVASSWGCKTCAAGQSATTDSVACTACPAGQSQEKGKRCLSSFFFYPIKTTSFPCRIFFPTVFIFF